MNDTSKVITIRVKNDMDKALISEYRRLCRESGVTLASRITALIKHDIKKMQDVHKVLRS